VSRNNARLREEEYFVGEGFETSEKLISIKGLAPIKDQSSVRRKMGKFDLNSDQAVQFFFRRACNNHG